MKGRRFRFVGASTLGNRTLGNVASRASRLSSRRVSRVCSDKGRFNHETLDTCVLGGVRRPGVQVNSTSRLLGCISATVYFSLQEHPSWVMCVLPNDVSSFRSWWFQKGHLILKHFGLLGTVLNDAGHIT